MHHRRTIHAGRVGESRGRSAGRTDPPRAANGLPKPAAWPPAALQKGVTMTDMMDRTLTRASLIRGGAAAGVGLAVGGLMGVSPSFAAGATQGDVDILIAAEIAEALAVTTYSNIIFHA